MTSKNQTPKPNEADLNLLKTGVPGLDEVLCGGLPGRRMYLIDGDPGAGKTTFGMQFLLEGAAKGECVLYVTLSESRMEMDAVAKSHGWDISKINFFELRTDEQLTADDQNTFFHPSEIELGETTQTIIDEVERIQPTRIVLDSLSELRLLAKESLRYRRQILALKQYFLGREMTVFLLDDRTSVNGDLELQSLVHGVIRLEQLAPEYGGDRRRLRIIKLRGVGFRGGFHDFALKPGGLTVYPRLIANEHKTTMEQGMLSSGVQELDDLTSGGLDRGSSTLLMGPAGSGKSTLALQYTIHAASQGEKSAVFAFDEGRRSIHKRMESLGYPIDKYIDNGLIALQQVDPAELSPGEFIHLIRTAVDKNDVKIVVIDSLNGYMNAMPEERFLTIQLHEVLSYLNQRGVCSIIVVAQHGLLGTAMDSPVDVSYLADTVMLTRYFEASGEVKKAISIVKRRSGPHERTIRELRMSSEGISVSHSLKNFHGVLTGVPKFLPSETVKSDA